VGDGARGCQEFRHTVDKKLPPEAVDGRPSGGNDAGQHGVPVRRGGSDYDVQYGEEMTGYIVRRIAYSLVACFATTIIVFIGVAMIGNPVDLLVTDDCNSACRTAATAALGLDQSPVQQYLSFMGNLLTGQLGRSFVFGTPVGTLLLARLPATAELAIAAIVLTVVIGFPLGLIAGLRPKSPVSKVIMGASIVGFSVPSFWVGIVLIWLLSIQFHLVPTIGRGETASFFGIQTSLLTWNGLQHLLLPAMTMALTQISLLIRLTQSGVQENMTAEYIRFARAQGLRPSRIAIAHLLRNVLIPIITVLGLEFGSLLAYGLVTETVFAWPGLGKLLIDSINLLDRPVIVTYLTITVLVFIFINLAVDIAYAVIDPRVRLY
jgi:peptide/nickel transport system permease protein